MIIKVTLQWMYDNTQWPNIPGTNGSTFAYIPSEQFFNFIIQHLFISITISSSNEMKFSRDFFAIIQKQKTSNYMLPFNLLSLKKNKIFVNKQNIQKYSQLSTQTYPNQPFLPTFWNELQTQIIMIPWLPYFSECTMTKKRILLKDMLLPSSCQVSEWSYVQSSFNPIQCKDKESFYKCVIQQKHVSNLQRSEWFHNPQKNIMYFHPQSIQKSQLFNYMQNGQIVDEISKSMYEQTPILFKSNLKIYEEPKEFVYKFYVSIDNQLKASIANVELTAYNYYEKVSENSQYEQLEANTETRLHVEVNYLSDIQKFYYMSYEKIQYYIVIPILISIIVFIILYTFRSYTSNYQIKKLLYLLISPMIKGLILSSLTAFSFTLIFLLITQSTKIELVATTYSGDDTLSMDLYKKYNGRNGLMLLITGFFILISSVKQSFKIPSSEQMKITIEDAQEQNQRQNVFNKNSSRMSVEFGKSYKINCYSILSDLLYGLAVATVGQAYVCCVVVMKAETILEFLIIVGGYILVLCVGFPLAQVKFHQYCCRLYKEKNPNYVEIVIMKNLKSFIKTQAAFTQYQLGLYFSSIFISYLSSLLLIPFVFLLLQSSFQQSKIFEDVYINYNRFQIIVLMLILLLPLMIYCSLLILQKFDKSFKLRMLPIFQLNQFQFKDRKVKWMSDVFRQNSTINEFFRQFQKFHYSSQLYIIIFLLAFSGINILLSIKIMSQNNYICFVDPALIFIFIMVWVVGDVLSMVLSYLTIKFKFYQKKQQSRMRTKLQSIEKFLKKNQYQKYMVLDQIKQHFLFTYKNWIVNNVQKILTKNMFQEDNNALLKKFKFYKNLLKRKSLMKRNSVSYNNNVNNVVVNQINNIDKQKNKGEYSQKSFIQDEGDKDKIIEKYQSYHNSNNMKTTRYKKGQNQSSNINQTKSIQNPQKATSNSLNLTTQQRKANRYQQWKQARVIKISKHNFTNFAKPLLYYWFYTAKQNTLIKSLIQNIKHQSLQPHSLCEFCNMDLDLQLIEKHDIEQIINQYRIINVGLAFIQENFIRFYKSKQEFIVVCFQCKEKKLYLQKKKIKNIRVAKIIVLNWLVKCKSQMLHRNRTYYGRNTNEDKKIRKIQRKKNNYKQYDYDNNDKNYLMDEDDDESNLNNVKNKYKNKDNNMNRMIKNKNNITSDDQ